LFRQTLRYLRTQHLALVAILIAVGGTSYAAFDPIGGDGDVDACYAKRGGDLTIRKGRKCGRGKKPLSWGQKGPPGKAGLRGPAGRSALEPLRSGESFRGVVGGRDPVAAAGSEFRVLETLPIPAPEPLTNVNVVVDGPYDDPTDICKGTFAQPLAPPGRLCIYGSEPSVGTNSMEEEGIAAAFSDGASPEGFALRYYSEAAGEVSLFARWIYTAP